MAVLISKSEATEFRRIYLQSGDGMDEAWLQEKLLQYPALLNHLPQCAEDPIVPICRELPLSGSSSTVFLDLLAVRRSGRPVLVECKLWRNPQARREVIGQTLEYAAIVRGLSYSDVQALVRRRLDLRSDNPICDVVTEVYDDIVEADFVDRFQNCLEVGDFDIVVAGDGIRSDVVAISELLNARGAGLVSLFLLDVQILRNGDGDLFLHPTTTLKTEMLRRQVMVDDQGRPVQLEAETPEELPSTSPEAVSLRLADRKFWDTFIENASFDHPEQDGPRHGGRNYVRLSLPEPANHMVCYRTRADGGGIGMYFRLIGEDGVGLFDQLQQRKADLEEQVGTQLLFSNDDGSPTISIRKQLDIDDASTEPFQRQWLIDHSNSIVNTFRPLLGQSREVGI
jgi:hypothetical protein